MAWGAAVDGEQREAARAIAAAVTGRLAEPDDFRAAGAVAAEQSPTLRRIRRTPYGLGRGEAGLAFAYGHLARSEDSPELRAIGRRYLDIAVQGTQRARHLPLGLFGGLAGVGAAALSLVESEGDYRNLLAAVDETLVDGARRLADALPAAEAGAPIGSYDLISGLAGMASYLVARLDQPGVADAMRGVVGAVADRTNAAGVPDAWHVPAATQHDEALAARHPDGVVNVGLAHGCPGVLAMLALARIEGIAAGGQDRAIAALGDWLVANRIDDRWGPNWSANVARRDGSNSGGGLTFPARAGWCYGSPGVARALQLAGTALAEPAYSGAARAAAEALVRRPREARRLDSPTFCHGQAGLLQVLLRFHDESATAELAAEVERMTGELIDAYDPDTVAGYRCRDVDGSPVDEPGLLDGALGVVLVLRAATTSTAPDWDRYFLVA